MQLSPIGVTKFGCGIEVWIPAFAGMTGVRAGMTGVRGGNDGCTGGSGNDGFGHRYDGRGWGLGLVREGEGEDGFRAGAAEGAG